MAGIAGGGGWDEAGLGGLHSVPPPQEHKSHVTVAVRVRGLDTGGYRDDDLPAIFPNEADSGRSLVIDGASRGATAFTFDSVFWSLAESKRCVGGMSGWVDEIRGSPLDPSNHHVYMCATDLTWACPICEPPHTASTPRT